MDGVGLVGVVMLPFIAALCGWMVTRIAVWMLFHPRKPIDLFGVRLLGLLPRWQQDLAQDLAVAFEQRFITDHDLQRAMQSSAVEEEFSARLESQVEFLLRDTASRKPLAAIFMSNDFAKQMKGVFMTRIKENVPKLLAELGDGVERRLNLKEILREKIELIDLSRLEAGAYQSSAHERWAMSLMGGCLGFICGLIQVAILLNSGR